MSVIDEVLDSLDSLKSRNPTSVVDMLCKLHDTKGVDVSSVLALANGLTGKFGGSELAKKNLDDSPFPDFGAEQASQAGIKSTSNATLGTVNRDSFMSALEETMISYQELLEKHNRDFDAIHAQKMPESEDETIARLRAAQLALLKYPIAGQAIYAALIREGRQYAKTPEGASMREKLGHSPVVAKARTLFEGMSGGMLAEHNSQLPSTYIDGFLDALDKDLEVVLSELGGVDDIV